MNSTKLDVAGLFPLLVSSACLLTYGMTAQCGGSGFLAVYIAGMILGNSRIVFKTGIRVYHDAAAWFSQIVMFIVPELQTTVSSVPFYLIPTLGFVIMPGIFKHRSFPADV